MSLIGPWTFEGQTNGVVPTVANSTTFGDPAFSAVSGATFCTYSTAQAKFGTVSLQFNVTTAATASVVDSADTAASSAAAHAWVYIGTGPTAEIQCPIVFRSAAGSANQARLQLTATNQLRNVFVSGPLNGTASTGTIPTAGWYRVESVVTGATGVAAAATMTTNVYDTTGTLLFAVPTLTGGTASAIDTIRWGKAGGTSTIQMWMDDLRQNIGSGTEIGPGATNVNGDVAGPATTAGGTVTGLVGVVGSVVAPAITAGGTVSGTVGAVGSVTAPAITAGGAVTGVVGKTGAVTAPAITAGGTVSGTVGKIGTVAGAITTGGTVAGFVTSGVVGQITGPAITAGGTVIGLVSAAATGAGTIGGSNYLAGGPRPSDARTSAGPGPGILITPAGPRGA
jgi:hypothetical protein